MAPREMAVQCVAVCGSVWQCVAVCGSVLQCVAVYSSMLQQQTEGNGEPQQDGGSDGAARGGCEAVRSGVVVEDEPVAHATECKKALHK